MKLKVLKEDIKEQITSLPVPLRRTIFNKAGRGSVDPQILAKIDFLLIDNDSEKKNIAKKYKPL